MIVWLRQNVSTAVRSASTIGNRAEEVYRHVYRVYPTLPSPYYESSAAA